MLELFRWVHCFRRSHGRAMKRGVTSGSVQRVRRVLTGCDDDALVYLVMHTGAACQLGSTRASTRRSARRRENNTRVFAWLEAT